MASELRNLIGKNKNAIKVPFEVQDFILKLLMHNSHRTDYFRSCVNCRYFGKDEVCTKFAVKPPAMVIANACEKWDDRPEDVPF